MEVATNGILHPETGLPPPGQKPSKKQAKLLQQRLERLARVNIHLQGKKLTNHHDDGGPLQVFPYLLLCVNICLWGATQELTKSQ